MFLLRGLAASLLWIVAGLLGLVGALLCATLVLLPVGIPLLMLAKKVFGYSMVVMVPGKVRHPVQHAEKSTKRGLKRAGKKSKPVQRTVKKQGRKARRAVAR
jgi:hypothetical protein